MSKWFLAAFALLLPALPLGAQGGQSDALLDRLTGRWVLRGQIAGKQVVHDVTCRWVLKREYVEMHEVSRERRTDGSPDYEAIVYFGRDARTKEYAVLWMDNTAYGAFDPAGTGHGYAVGDSIPFAFGPPSNGRVYNSFAYDRAHDTWESRIDNENAGVRKPFARVTLTRR